LFALAGFGVGFALLLLPWILGGGGMGDVKLLAALGVWLGPLLILIAFGGSALIAGATAVVVMAINTMQFGISSTRRRYLAVGQAANVSLPQDALQNAKKRRVLPFAVPVAMSTWLLLAWMLLHNAH
jgi:prepilin peptidase CpaA